MCKHATMARRMLLVFAFAMLMIAGAHHASADPEEGTTEGKKGEATSGEGDGVRHVRFSGQAEMWRRKGDALEKAFSFAGVTDMYRIPSAGEGRSYFEIHLIRLDRSLTDDSGNVNKDAYHLRMYRHDEEGNVISYDAGDLSEAQRNFFLEYSPPKPDEFSVPPDSVNVGDTWTGTPQNIPLVLGEVRYTIVARTGDLVDVQGIFGEDITIDGDVNHSKGELTLKYDLSTNTLLQDTRSITLQFTEEGERTEAITKSTLSRAPDGTDPLVDIARMPALATALDKAFDHLGRGESKQALAILQKLDIEACPVLSILIPNLMEDVRGRE